MNIKKANLLFSLPVSGRVTPLTITLVYLSNFYYITLIFDINFIINFIINTLKDILL